MLYRASLSSMVIALWILGSACSPASSGGGGAGGRQSGGAGGSHSGGSGGAGGSQSGGAGGGSGSGGNGVGAGGSGGLGGTAGGSGGVSQYGGASGNGGDKGDASAPSADAKADQGSSVEAPAADKPADDVGTTDPRSDSGTTGPITHRTLISGSGNLYIIGPTGNVEWTASGGDYDCWFLPNGNIVHAYGTGAREIKPDYASGKDGTVIWDRPTVDGETHSCQPFEEGKFLVTESHPGGISYILEIDRNKTELKKLQIPFPATETAHSQLRQARKLPSGNYLYCQQHDGYAIEIDPTGKELHRYPNCNFEALRLSNGNTLVTAGYSNQMIEYDPDSKVVWQVTPAEFTAMGFTPNFIAGVVLLDNGDLIFSNYGAPAAEAAVFQITREKKLVWSLKQPKNSTDVSKTTVARLLDGIPFPPAATP
jgi:hypothetical protein